MAAPTSASAVANAFLDIQAKDAGRFPPIDQMKIQKLVFYAHAWWLAQTGDALFDDDVEAWPWGPVVRKIYSSFKSCGRDPITNEKAAELIKTGDGPFDFDFRVPPSPSPEIMSFLEAVWASHKDMSGIQLSNATHAPNEPWTIVRDHYGSLDAKPPIPNELIRDVFRAKLAASDNTNTATAASV